jgi:hypothetical protein
MQSGPFRKTKVNIQKIVTSKMHTGRKYTQRAMYYADNIYKDNYRRCCGCKFLFVILQIVMICLSAKNEGMFYPQKC